MIAKASAIAVAMLASSAAHAGELLLEQVSTIPLEPAATLSYAAEGDGHLARFNGESLSVGARASDVEVTLVQSGEGHTALLDSVGVNNRISLAQAGLNNRAEIQQFGDSMTANVRQSGMNNVVTLRQQ